RTRMIFDIIAPRLSESTARNTSAIGLRASDIAPSDRQDRNARDAGCAVELRVADFRLTRHLPVVRPTAELQHHLVDLTQTRGADRITCTPSDQRPQADDAGPLPLPASQDLAREHGYRSMRIVMLTRRSLRFHLPIERMIFCEKSNVNCILSNREHLCKLSPSWCIIPRQTKR